MITPGASGGRAAPVAPIVLLPVGVDDDALDGCLAALEVATPAGSRVWLADDAQAGPRGTAIIAHWLQRTALQADYSRRRRGIGALAHLDALLAACDGADVVVLAADALPAPGWLQQLGACLARDPAIATATPWCNAGETTAWPRLGDVSPPPDDLARMSLAAATLPAAHPDLPSAVTHAVALRGTALQRAGGLDLASYGSWTAALVDLSLRLKGLGWRNALCETAYVARSRESTPADGDMQALAVRWPGWNARIAHFLMEDPLHGLRAHLQRQLDHAQPATPQRDLFA